MAKKQIIIVLMLLSVIFAVFGRDFLAISFDDTLCYNCGFDWETSRHWDIERMGSVTQTVMPNGEWRFDFGTAQGLRLLSHKNFDNEDVKIVLSNINDLTNIARNTLCGMIGASVQIGSCNVDVNGGTTGSIFNPRTDIIDVITSRIDNNRFEVLLNGERKCESSGNRQVQITRPIIPNSASCSGSLTLKSVRYRPLFGCTINDGESLAMESFVAGSKINLNSFRYPVKRFCLAHPVIITDEKTKGSDVSAEPYGTLIRADNAGLPQSFIIPEGQTYSFFYIFNFREANIQIACARDEAYNIKTNSCQNVKGIVTFCTQGQYDSARGACIVFPEIKKVCTEGRLENDICVFNPPVQAICKQGTYNDLTKKCHYSVTSTDGKDCDDVDYLFNPTTGVCEALPLKVFLSDVSCTKLGGEEKTVNGVLTCVYNPKKDIVCESGFSKETINEQMACVGVSQQKSIKQFLLQNTLLIVIVLMIVLVIIIYYKKRA